MFYSQMLESLVSLLLLLVCVSLIKKGYKRGEGREKRGGKTERGKKKERKRMIIWQGMCKRFKDVKMHGMFKRLCHGVLTRIKYERCFHNSSEQR